MAIDTRPTTDTSAHRSRSLDRAALVHRVRGAGPLSWALVVAVVGVLVGLVSGGNDYFDWSYALVDAMFAFGTAIAISWAGVPAFGQAVYFAIGGYSAALLAPHGVPSSVMLLAGGVFAAVVGWVFASLAINLPFASFAMLSLVFAEAGSQLIYTIKQLGGENGLYGVMRPSIGGYDISTDGQFYFYCVALLVVVAGLARWLYQSTTGRSIRAVRDEPLRAEALGVRPRRVRIVAFTTGSFVCGLAGVTYAQLQGVVDPSMGSFLQSTVGVMMVVIGGLGTFFGAVFGGIVYRWIELYVNDSTQSPDLWLGVVFVLVVLLTPVAFRGLARVRRDVVARRTGHGGEETP